MAHPQSVDGFLAGNRIGAWILPRPSDPATSDDLLDGRVLGRLGSTEVARRERARRPKVRTGCVTCKARRVKCDERKPTCVRCESARVACQGYVEAIDRRRKSVVAWPAATRPLAPRSHTPEMQEIIVTAIPPSISTLPLAGHQDGAYFDYFRHQVTSNLAGFYTCPVWSQLVSEGLHDDCIQHSILAVGALIRAVSTQKCIIPDTSSLNTTEEDTYAITQHRNIALRHHLKAVKSLRERIEVMATTAPRTVVVSTLLLVVFELVQGQAKIAETLLDSSLRILKDLITIFQTRTEEQARCVRDSGFQDMEHVLPCISVMSHLSNISRPQHQFPTFFRVEPELRSDDPDCSSISEFFRSWGRFFTSSSIFVGHSASTVTSTNPPDDIALMRQEILLSQLQRWKDVMVHYARSPLVDDASKKALRIAQIHRLLLHISLACCLDATQVAYDAFKEEFRELTMKCIGLFRDSLSHPRPTSVLLGQGLILPLCTVVRACRDHDIRMMAVEALNELPRSMVPWDIISTMDGILGAALLEEIGRDKDASVPPQARWFWLRDEDAPAEGTEKCGKIYQCVMLREDGQQKYARLSPLDNVRREICNVRRCAGIHSLDASDGLYA
ncbi:unnamed protein product [Clonostachys solani]|uniref:Zn(2)-C6 fungal-type domain-containing protein n=1 Tax=Clonostachys solani TaxID=160281 RepID=A0A9P0ERI8_9HYPO|nr:unnamed protein product [Clonostachys solani]